MTQASALTGIPVRVASAMDDPFHPGVVALAAVLPRPAMVEFSQGCHTGPFFTAEEPPSLEFLGAHLSAELRDEDRRRSGRAQVGPEHRADLIGQRDGHHPPLL